MTVLSLAQQAFPTPSLISFPCVGVDISDTSLKYVQFVHAHVHDENLTLSNWGDIEIPEGIIERGNVHDISKLAAVLREMKDRCDAHYVNISLPEEHAYLFETNIAVDTTAKEIHELLEFRLEENVPLSPRDAYFDYAVIGDAEGGKEKRVAVTVYAKATIDSYYEACREAGIIPLSFEIEAQAIARASVPKALNDTYMIVDFGKIRMGIGIVYRGQLMYTSTIDIAGAQMSADMRAVLGDVPESELTIVKNTKGLLHTNDNEKVALILEKVAQSIIEELSIRIHYWHTRGIDAEEREIKKIILCGGSSNLLGLPEYLTEKLEIQTERAQVWKNAFSLETYIPPITRKYSYGYATAIGLALRNFI
ncbi:MAG: pilus assembly protein PilM [Minisyncoccia bacterium]